MSLAGLSSLLHQRCCLQPQLWFDLDLYFEIGLCICILSLTEILFLLPTSGGLLGCVKGVGCIRCISVDNEKAPVKKREAVSFRHLLLNSLAETCKHSIRCNGASHTMV